MSYCQIVSCKILQLRQLRMVASVAGFDIRDGAIDYLELGLAPKVKNNFISRDPPVMSCSCGIWLASHCLCAGCDTPRLVISVLCCRCSSGGISRSTALRLQSRSPSVTCLRFSAGSKAAAAAAAAIRMPRETTQTASQP